jgi:hypothetical protein
MGINEKDLTYRIQILIYFHTFSNPIRSYLSVGNLTEFE